MDGTRTVPAHLYEATLVRIPALRPGLASSPPVAKAPVEQALEEEGRTRGAVARADRRKDAARGGSITHGQRSPVGEALNAITRAPVGEHQNGRTRR